MGLSTLTVSVRLRDIGIPAVLGQLAAILLVLTGNLCLVTASAQRNLDASIVIETIETTIQRPVCVVSGVFRKQTLQVCPGRVNFRLGLSYFSRDPILDSQPAQMSDLHGRNTPTIGQNYRLDKADDCSAGRILVYNPFVLHFKPPVAA
jgi:hypothetical protein